MYLVGSKMDKKAARMVKYEDGERLAQTHGAGFCEVSSKTRENVRKPFVEIVDGIVSKPELLAATRRGGGTVAVGGGGEGYGSGCSC